MLGLVGNFWDIFKIYFLNVKDTQHPRNISKVVSSFQKCALDPPETNFRDA